MEDALEISAAAGTPSLTAGGSAQQNNQGSLSTNSSTFHLLLLSGIHVDREGNARRFFVCPRPPPGAACSQERSLALCQEPTFVATRTAHLVLTFCSLAVYVKQGGCPKRQPRATVNASNFQHDAIPHITATRLLSPRPGDRSSARLLTQATKVD